MFRKHGFQLFISPGVSRRRLCGQYFLKNEMFLNNFPITSAHSIESNSIKQILLFYLTLLERFTGLYIIHVGLHHGSSKLRTWIGNAINIIKFYRMWESWPLFYNGPDFYWSSSSYLIMNATSKTWPWPTLIIKRKNVFIFSDIL